MHFVALPTLSRPTSTPLKLSLAHVMSAVYEAAHPRFPCVVKPLRSTNGAGVHMVRSMREYTKAMVALGVDVSNATDARRKILVEEAAVGTWEVRCSRGLRVTPSRVRASRPDAMDDGHALLALLAS